MIDDVTFVNKSPHSRQLNSTTIPFKILRQNDLQRTTKRNLLKNMLSKNDDYTCHHPYPTIRKSFCVRMSATIEINKIPNMNILTFLTYCPSFYNWIQKNSPSHFVYVVKPVDKTTRSIWQISLNSRDPRYDVNWHITTSQEIWWHS